MRIEAELRADRPSNTELRPEFADIGRLTRRLMHRTIGAARAEDASVGRLIAGHFGSLATPPSVAKATWPAYDRVNVQIAVEAWLGQPSRTHTVTGLVDYRHRDISLPDLLRQDRFRPGVGSVETEALPAGPGGQTLPCVQIGLYLTSDDDDHDIAVILLRGPEEHGSDQVHLEVACPDPDRAPQIVAEIKRLCQERNVFRGHVIEFGGEVFDYHRGALLSFVDRPAISRDEGQRAAPTARSPPLRGAGHRQDPYAAVLAQPAARRHRHFAVRPRTRHDRRGLFGGPGAAALPRRPGPAGWTTRSSCRCPMRTPGLGSSSFTREAWNLS